MHIPIPLPWRTSRKTRDRNSTPSWSISFLQGSLHMDRTFPPTRVDFQDPNLIKLSDIASKDEVDVSEALRVIASVLLSMEGYTLRDLRSRMANFDGWRIEFSNQFNAFKKGIEEARIERTNLELEQAQLIVNRSVPQKLSTSQKITAAMNAKKVDWSAW